MAKKQRAKRIKAVALLSGGLDSTLAVKLLLDQGIDVKALNFTSPFCMCDQKGKCYAVEVSKKFKIPLKVMAKGDEYLLIVRKPKFGYGSGMNPCIDCRIYTLKKAKAFSKKIGAKFIFTGEVLNQRPMSQHMRALKLIEREAGLEGKLLRPLSAKLLPMTEAERKGWVKREKLLAIEGRTRKPQIALAKKFEIIDYPCPGGGCLLTYKEFASKVRDLLKHRKHVTMKDMQLLKVGRHFRFGESKIIVGRNESENNMLLSLKDKSDYAFDVPNVGSPITILQDKKTDRAVKLAAQLTAAYSDAKQDRVMVKYGPSKLSRKIIVKPLSREEIDKLRV
jgi:tRNA-specific 2-thiouridylase